MKNFLTIGLLAAAGYILYKMFYRKSDLEVHQEEQTRMQNVAVGVQTLQNAIWEQFPLSTIGDTPLAGIQYDPFNPDSISSKPKILDLYPGIISY